MSAYPTEYDPRRWMKMAAVMEMLCVTRSAVHGLARRNRITPLTVCAPGLQGGRINVYWRSDVHKELARRVGKGRCPPSHGLERFKACRRIVAWANKLTKWPTDEEIEAKVAPGYGVENIVSVIENRTYRKLPALARET